MVENDKYYSATISLFIGITVFVVGILILVFNEFLYMSTIKLLLIVLLLNGIVQFTYAIRKRNNKSNLIKCIINMIIAIVLNMIPVIPQSIYPLLIGLYMVFYAFVKILIFILYKKNNIGKGSKELVEAFILLYLAYVIAINPLKNLEIILFVTGIYFIVLGTSFLINSIFGFLPKKIKKKIVINLPLFFEAFIPYTFFLNINKMLDTNENIFKDTNNENIKSSVEVLVHVSQNGYGKVGHVDIIYNDMVISYGNYDYKTRKLFEMIGEGVLFKTNKKDYIKFCIEHSHKMLFGFGLNLNEKQLNQIDNKIKEILDNCYEWKIDKSKKDYTYYLHKATKAKFYKFREGKFKSYFLFNTSCCAIANEIIGNTGVNVLKMNGIITPGAYYDRLNREYINKSGFITYRNIYTSKSYNLYFNEN